MKNFQILTLSLLFFSLVISSCKNDDEETGDFCLDYHWEYQGTTNTDSWSTCYADCGGQTQSPVNITGAVIDEGLSAITTNYESAPIEFTNNGHTLQFNYKTGSTINFSGDDYNLLQFHFHTGSEHTVGGQQFPMEIHLVHEDATTGNLAVIGIFFQEGNENEFLAKFIDNAPSTADETFTSTDSINVAELLPAENAYYTYTGSLTTPPCSEVVTWLVMKTPIEASSGQIEKIQGIIQDNYRPVQALNDRTIKEFN